MQSAPARHANSNGDPIDYRLSIIGYRLSPITYNKPSAIQGEARLRGLYWIYLKPPAYNVQRRTFNLRRFSSSERPKRCSDPRDALCDVRRRHKTKRQAERTVTPTIGIKMRAGNERYPVLLRFSKQRGCA